MQKNNNFLDKIADYYTQKITEHGDTPHGVDWNGQESQYLRFAQISKIIQTDENFSVNDLGCGYGAYFDFLSNQYRAFEYNGYDVSDAMIAQATDKYNGRSNARFIQSSTPSAIANYTVASGIFNVRLDHTDEGWYNFILNTLDIMDETSTDGFSFNCLTSYSDEDKKRDYLYYTDPCRMFDLCKKKYSRNVALLHDYDLYEFTVLVRKT